MTEKEYRAAEGVNKSTLWEMRKSPAHYKYILEHPAEDTAALRFGRALHAALLTPTAYKRGFAIAPDVDRRTKAGREQFAEWRNSLPDDVEELQAEEAQEVAEIVKSVHQNREAMDLLKGTRREYPIFWNDSKIGIRCKCRIDAMGADAIIDIKTVAEMLTFERDAFKYGYHVQAAHYLRGAEAKTGKFLDWYFLALEKKPPYCVKVIKATAGFIDYGDFVRQELLEKVKACQESGKWEGYPAGEISEPQYWGAD